MSQQPKPIFLLVSIIYLFFNSFLLPDGLLYTTLLTPFFFIHMLRHRGAMTYFGFLVVSAAFAIIQLPTVEFLREYMKSFIVLQTVAIFSINAYYSIKEQQSLAATFKILTTANMVMLVVSIICLGIPVLRPWLWYEISMSEGLPIIPRLKMLTYEASYYSLIITPLFFYYFLNNTLLHKKPGILLISLIISMVISFSFGVIATLIISIFLLYFLNLNELKRKIHLNYFTASVVCLILVVVLAWWFFPHNIIYERIGNILNGKDSSARGRTTESFILAWNIAKTKSVFFGIGLGQLKLIGRDYIIQYYAYDVIPAVTRIPNAVAETLNIFGLTGIVLRFGLIIFLFFKTKVWTNYYRLVLFIFMFVYQFTGSFVFNIVEYIIWALAFCPPLFTQFDRRHFMKSKEDAV